MNKYLSRKFLITLWAIIMLTIFTIYSLITGKVLDWFNPVFTFLSILIGGYVGIEGINDNRSIKKTK
jgi:K+ transporter